MSLWSRLFDGTIRLHQTAPIGFAAVLAALLCAPALWGGAMTDDVVLRANFEGARLTSGTLLRAYDWCSGEADELRRLLALGSFPWWSAPGVRFSFARPLASAVVALEHAAFGGHAWAYHLHSVLWFVALVAAIGTWLRRILPGALAALATILFAVDEAHFLSIGWASGVHALIASTFAVLALFAHARWRDEPRASHRAAALVAFTLALCASEVALSWVPFVLAYELSLAPRDVGSDRSSNRKRWFSALAPVGALLLAYVLAYRALHFGPRHSSLYLDPIAEAPAFIAALPVRALVLIGGLVFNAPIDVASSQPESAPLFAAVGALALICALALTRWSWGDLDARARLAVRFAFGAGALSLIPACGTAPSTRLLLAPSLAGAIVVASWLTAAKARIERRPEARAPKVVRASLLVLFGWASAVLLPIMLTGLGRVSRHVERVSLAALVPVAGSDVVVLCVSDPLVALFAGAYRSIEPATRPRSWRTLALSQGSCELTRISAESIELRTEGRMLEGGFERAFRGPRFDFTAGQRFDAAGLEVTIVATDRGLPTRARFRFDSELERERVFLYWDGSALRTVSLPSVGSTVTLVSNSSPVALPRQNAAESR